MNVFISWGGEPSKQLASLLREFLSVVVQECNPWMSEHDIVAGQPWDAEIEAALKSANFGILCITPQNIDNAYLHYEAGAIANQVSAHNRVCPVLLGKLTPSQLGQPLGRFQGKRADRNGIWELVQSLNQIAERPMETLRLQKAFDGQWPALETAIGSIPLSDVVPVQRSPEDLLEEILLHVRAATLGGLSERVAEPGVLPPSVRIGSRYGLLRQYERNLAGRIYRALNGTFEWSVEDTKAKVVIADGEATTLLQAQAEADAAAAARPLTNWHVSK